MARYNYKDPKRNDYALGGWVMGDYSLYRAAGEREKGDVKKLREALARREFEGVINNDGSLTYGGNTVHWRDLKK